VPPPSHWKSWEQKWPQMYQSPPWVSF
jgi:hypothetical protein